jgi:hypothetical protein
VWSENAGCSGLVQSALAICSARVSPLSILRQTHKLFYFLFDPFRKQRFDVSARLAKAIGMAIYFWIETCLAGRVFIFSGMEVEGCGSKAGGRLAREQQR